MALETVGIQLADEPELIDFQVVAARHQATLVEEPSIANDSLTVIEFNDNPPGGADWYEVVAIFGVSEPIQDDSMPPTGSVHAHPNVLWPPNGKMVMVTVEGRVVDEVSILRDEGGNGVSYAYLLVDGTPIDLTLDPDGNFSIEREFRAEKGKFYEIMVHACDTEPEANGGPNCGLVDYTYIIVPHDEGEGEE